MLELGVISSAAHPLEYSRSRRRSEGRPSCSVAATVGCSPGCLLPALTPSQTAWSWIDPRVELLRACFSVQLGDCIPPSSIGHDDELLDHPLRQSASSPGAVEHKKDLGHRPVVLFWLLERRRQHRGMASLLHWASCLEGLVDRPWWIESAVKAVEIRLPYAEGATKAGMPLVVESVEGRAAKHATKVTTFYVSAAMSLRSRHGRGGREVKREERKGLGQLWSGSWVCCVVGSSDREVVGLFALMLERQSFRASKSP